MRETDWNELTPAKAIELQEQLSQRIHLLPFRAMPRFVAGADVSFNRHSPRLFAGFVVLDSRQLEVVDSASAELDVHFPYIPGLLSFREIPALLAAWEKLRTKPEVVVVDGQGIAHPRRLGIASHLGLLLGIPTIGCGKSRLVGRYHEPGLEAGMREPLIYRGEEVGVVLRTKRRTKPLFVSPGHLMDMESAVRILLALNAGYRLPEPTRLAHIFVNEVRKKAALGRSH